MKLFLRITVIIYSLVSIVVWGVILVSPFSDKKIMADIMDFINVTFYQSNQYDIAIFVTGVVFFLLSIVILTLAIRSTRAEKFICKDYDTGSVRISTTAVENIALSLSNRFQGVKETKAKAYFTKNEVVINLKLSVMPDVHVPNLCKGIQERIKESVELSMDIPVKDISINVENVHTSDE
ncbi:MAG: alkaline shock response membrane anchor protein AmaP [Clostridia bacterium]|nr:alkaline shock response membrane anchor protein AmaP [Clostridia bacterium]